MRILMIGDVMGQPGRKAVSQVLPDLRIDLNLDLVIANGENAAAGFGITIKVARELLSYGVDAFTSGNHIWDKLAILPYMDGEIPLIRPLNYPENVPGRGSIEINGMLITNLLGRTFINPAVDCPFRTIDKLLMEKSSLTKIIIVDLHAEATSEKVAMGWYLDGRVSAVLGTHTHVGTVDYRILPEGTAYVTDVGMAGTRDSVIGSDTRAVLERFLTGIPVRLEVATGGSLRFNSIFLDIDETTGKSNEIRRIDREVD